MTETHTIQPPDIFGAFLDFEYVQLMHGQQKSVCAGAAP
jgi:hypothetical protein